MKESEQSDRDRLSGDAFLADHAFRFLNRLASEHEYRDEALCALDYISVLLLALAECVRVIESQTEKRNTLAVTATMGMAGHWLELEALRKKLTETEQRELALCDALLAIHRQVAGGVPLEGYVDSRPLAARAAEAARLAEHALGWKLPAKPK